LASRADAFRRSAHGDAVGIASTARLATAAFDVDAPICYLAAA